MPAPGRPPVMLDIVEEHFDELDFLWEQREANLFTPDWERPTKPMKPFGESLARGVRPIVIGWWAAA